MAKLVYNRDGGKTDELGHMLGLSRILAGEVIDGLQVVANGVPNMSVVVGYGTGAIPTGSAGTAYRYFMGIDSNENVTIPTANGSNPRNDLVVAYIDKAVAPSTGVTNNSNNILKFMVVSGAPAVTPADPSGATIQAAVGAANPYIILARVLTGAGVTQINNGNITDLRSMASARILAGTITTAMLQDLGVTTAKIAANAVTKAKLSADLTAMYDYSTSEVATGAKWIDGKTIYKKTISFGALPNNSSKNVAHGISGLTRVMNIETEAYEAAGPYYYTFGHVNVASLANGIAIYVDGTNVVISTGSNRVGLTANITLYYTK